MNFARILQERGQVTSEEAMDGNIGFWIYAISSSFHFLISSFASELFFRDGRSMLMALEEPMCGNMTADLRNHEPCSNYTDLLSYT